MNDVNSMVRLLKDDPRYAMEAYVFVREALVFAQDVLRMSKDGELSIPDDPDAERHLTGQQLCEAIREYAVEQYGYMAQVVLKTWGITTTGDFGEIVYNLIRVGEMKKSPSDDRTHFDNVYEFDEVFRQKFKIRPRKP